MPRPATNGPGLPLSTTLPVWLRVAAQSFGGPAGQIAVMHRLLVEEKRWVSEERFLHALSFCMLLPGPEAQQLATYLGWLLSGRWGGLLAGGLFVLPGFLAIGALSLFYLGFGQLPAVEALFFGLKGAVIALVAEALLRIGRRALRDRWQRLLALATFVGLALLHLPFPLLLAGAAFSGWLAAGRAAGQAASRPPDDALQVPDARPLATLLVGGGLWLLPILLAAIWLGSDHVLTRQGLFFSQAAVLTFGGAYAVLAYIGQQAVERFGWLSAPEMLDGLGLAETTPGPLIQVVQFVAFLGAYRHPGELPPLAAGLLGAVVTTWVTFVPSFLWVFLGGPYVERLRSQRALTAALSGVTAAVVGVIASLGLWFTLHTLFAVVDRQAWGPFDFELPAFGSFRPAAAAVTGLAAFLLFRCRLGMGLTLVLSSAVGALLFLAGGGP